MGFISVLNTSINNIYPFQSRSSPKTKGGVFFDPAVQKVSAAQQQGFNGKHKTLETDKNQIITLIFQLFVQ